MKRFFNSKWLFTLSTASNLEISSLESFHKIILSLDNVRRQTGRNVDITTQIDATYSCFRCVIGGLNFKKSKTNGNAWREQSFNSRAVNVSIEHINTFVVHQMEPCRRAFNVSRLLIDRRLYFQSRDHRVINHLLPYLYLSLLIVCNVNWNRFFLPWHERTKRRAWSNFPRRLVDRERKCFVYRYTRHRQRRVSIIGQFARSFNCAWSTVSANGDSIAICRDHLGQYSLNCRDNGPQWTR